jgi:hypothetical protein
MIPLLISAPMGIVTEPARATALGLVAPAPTNARASTGIDSATLRTNPGAAGFLRARFVDLQRASLYAESVHLPDGSRHVFARPKLNKSETAGAPAFAIANHPCRSHLKSLAGE